MSLLRNELSVSRGPVKAFTVPLTDTARVPSFCLCLSRVRDPQDRLMSPPTIWPSWEKGSLLSVDTVRRTAVPRGGRGGGRPGIDMVVNVKEGRR